jgi:hypothetical protein
MKKTGIRVGQLGIGDDGSRRGVLLLLVLALLSMFGLIAIAFVVLTGHAQRGAKSLERIGQTESLVDSTQKTLLHQAAMQIFRGPNSTSAGVPNSSSVMGAHSLLETMYGNSNLLGQLTVAAQSFTDGTHTIPELLQLKTNLPVATVAPYCGCVLTITGPTTATVGYGQSTRIVAIDPTSGANAMVYVTAFPDGSLPVVPATFTINGAPFNGMGFGYNSTTQTLDLMYDSAAQAINPLKTMSDASTTIWPVALLPRLPLSAYSAFGYNPPNGVNTDYTAADFQHMLLAAQVPTAAGGIQTLPSLHRPALCRYWATNPNGLTSLGLAAADFSNTGKLTGAWTNLTATDVALLRQIMLRPVGQFKSGVINPHVDHPNFTGSNPNFNPFWNGVTAGAGQWDVDNDGDGVPDSVWVDLGMPVRATSDGHLYKPLFAILCTDLDGRLNVNAHGNITQTDGTRFTTAGTPSTTDATKDVGTGAAAQGANFAFAGGTTTAQLARGQGYGPAEITLAPLFSTLTGPGGYQQLFTGIAGNPGLDGRYGEVTLGVDSTTWPGWPYGNLTGTASSWPKQQAGWYGVEGALSGNKWYQFHSPSFTPAWSWWNFQTVTAANQYTYNNGNNSPDSFGSPPDTFGVGAVGLDVAGRPLYLTMGGQTQNSPYELNLSANVGRGLTSPTTAADNLFGSGELERILRPFDRDAPSLPRRLAALAPNLVPPTGTTSKRLSVTTDSWDVPTPAPSIITVLNGRTDFLYGPSINRVPATKWSSLFAPELLAGLKMDITRPLGYWSGNLLLYDTAGKNKWPAPTTNFSPDGTVTAPQQARQLYARYLYVMALLFDDQYWAAVKSGPATTVTNIAQYTAQWAVNVVDFQSPDSAMTPFKYDSKPFAVSSSTMSNWAAGTDLANPKTNDAVDIKGTTVRLGSDCGVVWGCKRPELLISETLAFHDRRTQDLSTDSGSPVKPHKTTTSTNPDPNFDQGLRPQGSLFVELYNPGTNLEAPPTDLHRFVSTGNWGVDLERLSPGGYPVWQMLIVDKPNAVSGTTAADPDNPTIASRPAVERAIYFANGTIGGVTVQLPSPPSGCQVQYQPISATGNQFAPILPSRYALIGPGDPAAAVPGRTYIGGGATPPAGTPWITLTPNTDPDSPPVPQVTANLTFPVLPNATARNATAVLIHEPWFTSGHAKPRLSVSEPPGGYVTPTGVTYSAASDSYNLPIDTPLDTNPMLMTTKFSAGVKKIFLQRLADPTIRWNPDDVSDPKYNPNIPINPYRTIDAMPIDLQAFNGTADPAVDDPGKQLSPWKDDVANWKVYFHSRQRGDTNGAGATMNLWQAEDPLLTKLSPPAAYDSQNGTHLFPYQLQHSLTFLNTCFGPPTSTPGPYLGDPQNPFPWLTWPRRPLASPLEALLVPAVSSSQLLSTYNIAQAGNPYDGLSTPPPSATVPFGTTSMPFPHLGCLFQSPPLTNVPPVPPIWPVSAGPPYPAPSPGFYRMLDYLYVPSRFVGTEIQIDPTTATAATGHSFHPPFNRISTYREPGRINLNTIYTPETWAGLMSSFSATMANATSFNNFIQSRRGYTATAPWDLGTVRDILAPSIPPPLSGKLPCPTEFARPFRSPRLAQMMVPNVPSIDTVQGNLQPTRETDVTVLRANSGGANPLFQYTSTNAADNCDRNPFFRYQAIQRLGNLVTTRSNVYAVWITVGYFEVNIWDPNNPLNPITKTVDAAHPDGYQLGQELGSDTGEIQRHRAFYIFDRTIPVGFQRGQDLNVEKAILVKRFIE